MKSRLSVMAQVGGEVVAGWSMGMASGNSSIDLAREEPFRIGNLQVDPPLRRISNGETLEPRVMQVLVVLARARGAVISRDELIQTCWGGRIVGEDSINRVISRLRRLAVDLGDGAFTIETVPKIGYRLIGEFEASSSEASASDLKAPAPCEVHTTPARGSAWRPASIAVTVVGLFLVVLLLVHPYDIDSGARRPVVEVEPFTMTAPGLPPGLSAEVRAETADLLTNERYYAVSMASHETGSRPDWRVRGTIAPEDDGRRVLIFAQLIRASNETVVAELRLERDARQLDLARSIGLRVGRTSGCIMLTVTNPDLTGGYVTSALPALAHACLIWHDKTTASSTRIDAFRAAADALPKSAYFPARIAEMLGDLAADGAPNAAALRTEGLRYVADAERIDKGQPHIFLAKARLLPALDLLGREAMIKRALAARPSDCACEFGDYSTFLSMVGRNKAALWYAQRAREREPKNILWLRRTGEAAALSGDFDTARAQLADVASYLPDPSNLDDWRFNLGIWSKDWMLARAMVARQPDPELRALQSALVTALASGERERIETAGLPFATRARVEAANDRAGVSALVVSGRDDDAIQAVGPLLERRPYNLSMLFDPSFTRVRRSPAFARLATKFGLLHYWHVAREPPDFCGEPDPPSVCRMI